MNKYTFTVILEGEGDTPEDAWANAVEAFAEDPGEPLSTSQWED